MNLEIENFNKNINSDNFSNNLKEHLEKINTTFSIDRFEENYAVCENLKTGEFINVPTNLLPTNSSEGSILKFENGKYVLDEEKTKLAREETENLVNNLFPKNKSGQ